MLTCYIVIRGQENDSPIGEVGKIEEIQISAASCT